MAEEFVRLVKIGIDKGFIQDSIANADRLAKSIDELKKIRKEEGTLTAEQEGRLKALTQERNKNIQVVKQANLLASEQIKGQERLKAQLSILTAQYNKLTTEEQKNTKEGQALQKQILGITEELKANEKAVGDNRRNVGNYEDALKALPAPMQGIVSGLKGMVTAAKAFIATPLGIAIAAISAVLAPLISYLTKTKEGSELLTRVMAGAGAAVNVLTDRLSMLGEAIVKVFQGDFEGAANIAKESIKGVTDEIIRETQAGVELEKRMQKLVDAERALNVERSKSRAEVKELNMIAEDTSKTLQEREAAAQRAIEIEKGLMDEQVRLAQERFDIIKAQNEQGESLAEDLDRQAEAEIRLGDIRRESLELQTTLQNKLNVIRQQDAAQRKKAAQDAAKASEEEKKAADKAAKDAEKALEESFQMQRQMIDAKAELEKAQAEITIANAEERAERIAFIEKEALLAKLRSIEDETVAYTASADAIGTVDEKKYAKQLTERAKYEAQLAAIDREAKADEFNREMELLATREELANQQAEIEIANTEEREAAKQRIALKYLNERLALMEKSAMLDDIITEQERANLQKVRNEIELLQQTINNPDNKTIADMIGLSDEDLEKMFVAMEVVNGLLQAAQQATQQASDNKINNIERELQAEVNAINQSTKSEEDKEEAITKAEKKAAKEQYKIEVQQFKTAKALQIALAVANTATAVMAQLSNPTPYAGFVLAALAAATGAIQIGTIASQQPPPPPAFATGGKVIGAGTGTSDSIPARLSNGEAVINAKSTAMFEPILSAMNKAGGGVDWYRGEGFSKGGIVQKFAAGGVAMSSGAIMRDNIATREIQQTILNAPPVLVIEEFQSVQGRQVRTKQNLQV